MDLILFETFLAAFSRGIGALDSLELLSIWQAKH
jgi:hypothetical protein